MTNLSMKDLLESGAHFGHQVSRWNPKMKTFIYTKRNGIHIINLQLTIERANKAFEYIKNETIKGKKILFIGTKKQNQDNIQENAKRCGAYYITHRWLGGMLTNFKTIKKRLDHFKELEDLENDDTTFYSLTKKEVNKIKKKKNYLEKVLNGIRDMENIPDMIFVLDILKDHISIQEAKKLGITVIALVDSNTNPDPIDFPIPANDDAMRSTSLFLKFIADAVLEGKNLSKDSEENIPTESKEESQIQEIVIEEDEEDEEELGKKKNRNFIMDEVLKSNTIKKY